MQVIATSTCNWVRPLSHIKLPNRVQLRWTSHFKVVEHITRCQHTRDRAAGAERGRENELKLHVHQYIPKTNPFPRAGDVTIIGAHANGFPKEMLEPFWDDLHERMQREGSRIRGIWIADIASQGRSGIINERNLGPDASWLDHGRDLLYLINQFQDAITHPIVGVGHSVGASHLVHLALLHPRLLHSLVLVDPIIQDDLSPHKIFARLSTTRRDIWPSRSAAAAKFASNKYYQLWDPRALRKWIEYGLRDLPTEQHPVFPGGNDGDDVPVTLSTTVAQEVYFYLQPLYRDDRLLQDEENISVDTHASQGHGFPFARPEMQQLYRQLPELRPSVQYIFGCESPASSSENRRMKMELTGTGTGGSGGADRGRVRDVVLECGHLVGFEQPGDCADATAEFIGKEMRRWEARERKHDAIWSALSRRERVGINATWRKGVNAK